MFEQNRRALSPECLSDLVLDQWYSKELDAAGMAQCEAHVTGCAACAERWASIRSSAADFLARFPSPQLETRPPELAASPPSVSPPSALATVHSMAAKRRAMAGALGAALAAAAALVVWLQSPQPDPGSSDGPMLGTRTKGEHHISFFVRREGRVLPGSEDMVVYPGDQIRFVANVTEPQHVAVLSLDGAGTVSVYHQDASPVQPSAATTGAPLPSSVVLDGVLGRERIWALFCSAPIALGDVENEVRHRGVLTAPDGCSVDEVTWRKEAQ